MTRMTDPTPRVAQAGDGCRYSSRLRQLISAGRQEITAVFFHPSGNARFSANGAFTTPATYVKVASSVELTTQPGMTAQVRVVQGLQAGRAGGCRG